ncbi:GNAT family N-acetyltransferase [Streptosporangium sp. NPDC004631]
MNPSASEPTDPKVPAELRLVLRKADSGETGHIFKLLENATTWLQKVKNRDQWATDGEGRRERIRKGIRSGHTWIAWDGEVPVATLTLDTFAPQIWARWEQRVRAGQTPHRGRARRPAGGALYVHRLIVRRDGGYSGQGVGAELLDWAATRAAADGLESVRVDVWTTNVELHQYYIGHGFKPMGIFDDLVPGYAACALFERPAEELDTPRLVVEGERPDASLAPRGTGGHAMVAGASAVAATPCAPLFCSRSFLGPPGNEHPLMRGPARTASSASPSTRSTASRNDR